MEDMIPSSATQMPNMIYNGQLPKCLVTLNPTKSFQTRLAEFRDWTLSGLNGSEREKGGVGAGREGEGEVVARQLSKRGAISMWQI